jgi:hypothetical protein
MTMIMELWKSTVSMASVMTLIVAVVAADAGEESSSSSASTTSSSSASNSVTDGMVWIVVCAGIAVTLQLMRASIDLIQTASQSNSQHFQEAHHGHNKKKAAPAKTYGSVDKGGETNDASKDKEASPNSETESLLGSTAADSVAPSS